MLQICCGLLVLANTAFAALSFRRNRRTGSAFHLDVLSNDTDKSTGQVVHWVFVTDCSAYQFNQGNLMLASAKHVEQPGEFTWVMYGCDRDEQKAEMKKLAHPRAKVYHAADRQLKHPLSGKDYPPFQASNRPVSLLDWWQNAKPTEEAIGILDPDEFWMRAVHHKEAPRSLLQAEYTGPWETQAVSPKHASGAYYGIGCAFDRISADAVDKICGGVESCKANRQSNDCEKSYSSGPPWVLHRDDAEKVLPSWIDTAILTHEAWPDLLAEQASYGFTQAKYEVKSSLDSFWFLSSPAPEQPWNAVMNAKYDPCQSREPPPASMNLPPLWHACSTWEIPHLVGQGFRLHKDHIHKDLLDCDAPLIHYPPQDALTHYYTKDASGSALLQADQHAGFQQTWAVCAYTNLVNHHAATYKKQFCKDPNLSATATYPDHAQSFLSSASRLNQIFRKGGWTDVDYKTGKGR